MKGLRSNPKAPYSDVPNLPPPSRDQISKSYMMDSVFTIKAPSRFWPGFILEAPG
jgi:hypothetical protein